jgi:chemotaxis protein methyltransferase CheR
MSNPGNSSTHRVPREMVLLFRDLIHQNTGIYFEEQWLDLFMEKIRPLIEARRASLMEYYYLLKYDEESQEWSRVIDALSVQETYFWREMSQIEALVKEVVPAWFRRSEAPLRIWSAACATGEEPLTIAMALREAGWAHYPIEIVASDASEAALAKARAGVFRERSFRALPPPLKEKYFTPLKDTWQISPELLQQVNFRRANLVVRPEVADLVRAPVIFCRNVFIYFSRDSILRTISHFAEGMPKNGHLFVGISESLLNVTSDFTLQEIGESFVYVRGQGESR